MKKKGQPKRKATLMMLVAFVFGSVITTCMHPGVGRCVLVQQVKGNATADMVVVVMMWIDSRTLRIYAYVICTLYLYIGCSIQDYRHIHVHISAYVRIASTIWNCRDFLHHQKPVGWNNKKRHSNNNYTTNTYRYSFRFLSSEFRFFLQYAVKVMRARILPYFLADRANNMSVESVTNKQTKKQKLAESSIANQFLCNACKSWNVNEPKPMRVNKSTDRHRERAIETHPLHT